jgi:hypothetical protein
MIVSESWRIGIRRVYLDSARQDSAFGPMPEQPRDCHAGDRDDQQAGCCHPQSMPGSGLLPPTKPPFDRPFLRAVFVMDFFCARRDSRPEQDRIKHDRCISFPH